MSWRPLVLVDDDPEAWANDAYIVTVRREPDFTVLGIIHRSGRARHDWRDFQRIKNDVLGDEIEAVELYPAESRLMDAANQFFLFALPLGQTFPFGFRHRDVRDDPLNPDASQRPLPADWQRTL